ncbi:CBO0543 family protein [Bacillus sp. NEB1478]|uniref:CBO0543 family protein n=1 Tax=Bacillus sp. NEB1478 TaxID=3073816 RepID=UPI00287300DB|nr:CBO0543 family protein [Bacillus sp. NEB1478]WNB91540.1 CBO0543 family protein [Bacillus sp. NEB1478]
MKKQMEINILRSLFVISLVLFINLIRKPPIKDWLIIFLLKSYISSFLDTLLVKLGYLKYPVNLFKIFDISVLFSYLIFPVTCIYFNQMTQNSNIIGTFVKSLLFSAPSTIVEYLIERKTNLIKYKKSWTPIHSFASITATFLFVRLLMILINKISIKQRI